MPGSPITTPAQSKKYRSSGGIGHDIWHVLSGTGRGLYHGVTGLPTGAYMTGRSVLHDARTNPLQLAPPNLIADAVTGKGGRTSKILRNTAKQEYSSYRHFGKGGDISGPLLDASAFVTGGASLGARGAKVLDTVSATSKAARAARAAELIKRDTAVMQAVGGGGIKGAGFDRAASIYKIPASELKKHYRRNMKGLQEGNFSVGKKAGQQGKYANQLPHEVLANPKHELFDFYANRYPEKISTATRARKAFMTKPQYSRPMLKGGPLNKSKSGFYVPTSPNPIFRGVRKGVEQVRTNKSANREILKESVRREITQERFNAPKVIRTAPRKAPPPQSMAAKAIGVPMSALRMAMWMRPRYYLQNMGQTGQMLAANPILTAKSAKLAAQLYAHNRDLYHSARAVTGEAQAGALAAGTSPSKLGNFLGNKIPGRVGTQIKQRGIQGAMGYAANIPESHVRMLSVLNELQKHNRSMGSLSDLTPEKVQAAFDNVRRTGVISKEHLPMRRAVEEVGDFGRIFSKNMLKQSGMSEREFMATQLPIFYPMFKALTRYGVRFPSEHSILSAGGVALGKQGKIEQKRLLGDLPFWGQYLIPKSAGDPNAHHQSLASTYNPSSIYNFQPAADIGRQTAELTRRGGPNPGISYLQESGPAGAIIYGLLTGKDIQTGYPIKPLSKKTYKKHPGLNISPVNVGINFAEGLPLASLAPGAANHVRSYVKPTTKGRLLNELIGPSVISRQLKTKETTKQAKRESSYGQGRKKKKSTYNP